MPAAKPSEFLAVRLTAEQRRAVTANALHHGYDTVSAAVRDVLERAGYLTTPATEENPTNGTV